MKRLALIRANFTRLPFEAREDEFKATYQGSLVHLFTFANNFSC